MLAAICLERPFRYISMNIPFLDEGSIEVYRPGRSVWSSQKAWSKALQVDQNAIHIYSWKLGQNSTGCFKISCEYEPVLPKVLRPFVSDVRQMEE